MPRFCSSCGTQMDDTATACPKCGKATGLSVSGGMAAAPESSTGLADNVASALAYLLIPAIIFLILEPYSRNKTIRFHCFQSIILFVALFVVNLVVGFIPVINLVLLPFLGLAEFILWIVLVVQAFQGKKLKLPVIGEMAEKQANA